MFSYKNFLLKNTLLICVTFSVLFTLAFYLFQYKAQKEIYTNNSRIYADKLAESISDSVLQTRDLSVIFKTNPDFKNYADCDTVTPYTRRKVAEYLVSTISSMPSINSRVYVTRNQDEYMISTGTVMTVDYFAENYGIAMDKLTDAVQNTTKGSIPEPTSFSSYADGTNYLTVIIRDNISFKNPYLIISVFDLDKLRGAVPFDAELIIRTNNDTVLLNGRMNDKETEAIKNGDIPSGYKTLYKNTYATPATGEMTLSLVMKKWKYLASLNTYTFYTIPLGILFFILSYMISKIMVNRSHRPILGVLDQISSINGDSKEDEIKQISSAISLLSSRNKKLLDVVDSNNAELRTKFINDLLYNRLPKTQAEFGIKAYLSDYKNAMPLSVIIISIDNYDADNEANDSAVIYTYYSLVKSMFEQAFMDAAFFHFTSLPPSTYCIVLSAPDAAELKIRLQDVLLMAETDIGINMHVTISDDVPSWDALSAVFNSVYLTHISSASSREPYSIVDTDDLDISFFYPSELEAKIFNACIRSDKKALGDSLSVLVSNNFPTEQLFAVNCAPLSTLLYALATRVIASLSLDENDIFGNEYSVYLDLKSCRSSDEFYRKCMTIFNTIIDYNAGIRNTYESSYCDQMLSFVHDNYKNNISLQDIAAHMNMSQAYVSRLFKKLVNSNFKDYLTKIRLDNAAKLLIEQPGKTIQAVASECGFNTTRTFTNAFSAAFGMTPTKYRHKHLR